MFLTTNTGDSTFFYILHHDLLIYCSLRCYISKLSCLGNDNLYRLTSSRKTELLILMEAWDGVWKYASYSEFYINSEADKYRLRVSGFSGTAGIFTTVISIIPFIYYKQFFFVNTLSRDME